MSAVAYRSVFFAAKDGAQGTVAAGPVRDKLEDAEQDVRAVPDSYLMESRHYISAGEKIPGLYRTPEGTWRIRQGGTA